MKSVKLRSVVLFSSFFFLLLSCEKEIQPKNAPQEIKTYVSTYFSDCVIQRIVRDRENGVKCYDVTLDCGVNLEFEEGDRLQIIDIDSHSKLPDATIAQPIRDYVSTHFQGSSIIAWEYEANKTLQHINLSTKQLLEFDSSNKFIKIVKNK